MTAMPHEVDEIVAQLLRLAAVENFPLAEVHHRPDVIGRYCAAAECGSAEMKDGPFLNFHVDDIARVFRRFFTLNLRECDGNVAFGRVEPCRSAIKDFPDARVGKALADGDIV